MLERAIVKVLMVLVFVPVAMRCFDPFRGILMWVFYNTQEFAPVWFSHAITDYLYPGQAFYHFRGLRHGNP